MKALLPLPQARWSEDRGKDSVSRHQLVIERFRGEQIVVRLGGRVAEKRAELIGNHAAIARWRLKQALGDEDQFAIAQPPAGVDGPVAQDRCWAERGVATIRADVGAWLSRVPDKLRHTYNHESFAIAYLAEADPAAWERDHTWRVMNIMTSIHHALMLAAALKIRPHAKARLRLDGFDEPLAPPVQLVQLGSL